MLLCLLEVSSFSASNVNIIWFVPGIEIDNIPDGEERVWNDSKDISGSQFTSSAVLIRVEEDYGESGRKDCWYQQQKGNQYVPPMDEFVQYHVEDLSETCYNKDKGEYTDGNNTAFDWETPTARFVSGFWNRALTNAAAAHICIVNGSV